MLVICLFERVGNKQGASRLFTAANAVEEINENLDSTGDYPEGRLQLNKPSGRYSHDYAVPA
jgi:hypothetical protein